MANAALQATRIGYNTWRLNWSAANTPFRLALRGFKEVPDTDEAEEDHTSETSLVVTSDDPLEPPPLEVYDNTDVDFLPETLRITPHAVIQWRGSKSAKYYRVEIKIDAGPYRVVSRIFEEGLGYYQLETGELSEDSDYTFRVIAIDINDVESDALSVVLARPPVFPTPPRLDFEYSQGAGGVVITERS